MHKLLRVSILIIFGMLIIGIISGCGDDSPEVVTDPSDPTTSEITPPRTIEDHPPNTGSPFDIDHLPGGAPIAPNTQFTLTFEQAVDAVAVNGVAATGAGDRWTVSPLLPEGDGQILHVTWTNRDGSSGSHVVGPYTVRPPDTTPPSITSGTVADGSVNINPALINADGIRFDFNEDITGSIKLTDEAGVDLNWAARVAGQTAILTPFVGQEFAGQELVNETIYKIEIDFHDGAGNQLRMTITFVTKPK